MPVSSSSAVSVRPGTWIINVSPSIEGDEAALPGFGEQEGRGDRIPHGVVAKDPIHVTVEARIDRRHVGVEHHYVDAERSPFAVGDMQWLGEPQREPDRRPELDDLAGGLHEIGSITAGSALHRRT